MPGSFWDALSLDGLFVELKDFVQGGRFGPIRGASFHITASAPADGQGCVSFLGRLFGSPTELIRNSNDRVMQYVAIYSGSWALQCTLVELTPETPPLQFPASIHGSLSFPRTLLEVRWGAERLIAAQTESGSSETFRFPPTVHAMDGGSYG